MGCGGAYVGAVTDAVVPCPRSCEDGFTVRSTRLLHRVPCWGYVIQEPQGEGEGQGQGRKVVVLGDTHCSDHLVDIGRGCGA